MTTRKTFLAATPLLAMVPALSGLPEAADAATPAPAASSDSYVFDQTAFNTILSKQVKHKQCFGSKEIDQGGVMGGMQNTINAYVEYLNESPDDVQTVAVLYHGTSIGLAMNDSIWNTIIAPFMAHPPDFIRDQFKGVALGKGNPFLRQAGKDSDDVSVEKLVAQGASFFVCHNALRGFAMGAAASLKRPRAEVYQAVLNGVVPGSLVVPAGVMAINACQEARFTYIAAN